MKLDDYSEFDNEKPDEEYDEPTSKNSKKSSVRAKIIMALLVLFVAVWVGIAVIFSFKNNENSYPDTDSSVLLAASVPEKTEREKTASESQSDAFSDETGDKTDESERSESNEVTMEFLSDNEQVTAKEVVNLRSMPSTTNENCVILGTLSKGELLHRVGINYEMGWSKLEYNDRIVYAVTSYLEVVK